MQVKLTNETKKLCAIGDPVGHSKSPLIHNTMLEALGLDYIYLAQYVPRGGAAEWLRAAKTAGYAGFNATMPHKLDLMPLMDELDEDARMYGAVNTVVLRDGMAFGSNTDGRGFDQALRDQGVDPEGRTAVLLGAGGVGVHIQLPPGCRSRRAGYSAYLDAATGRDGPAVSLRGVQRPAARDSRGHYNGYILRLQSHCGKPAAVLV